MPDTENRSFAIRRRLDARKMSFESRTRLGAEKNSSTPRKDTTTGKAQAMRNQNNTCQARKETRRAHQ